MRNLKKLITLILCVLISVSLFASEGDWWDGKAMTAFKYSGLQNVKARTIDSLLSDYVGQKFTDETFSSITNLLYSQDWMSWFSAEAELAEGTEDLVIALDIHENQYIESITFNGNDKLRKKALEEAQNLSVGGFFTQNQLNANKKLLLDAYLDKGYLDANVEASYTENEETNRVSITYNITEGKQYKVRSIDYQGLCGVSAKELNKILKQKTKSFFNSGNFKNSNVDADKSAIISYYATKGYPDAKISDVIIASTNEDTDDVSYVSITYVIEEGSLWTIGDISFEGNTVFSNEAIQEKITVAKGEVFNLENVASMIDNISSLYYDAGYIRAYLNPVETRDTETHTISYNISIIEGPQSVVEEIVISGLTKTKSYVFEREVAMKVGDVFSRADYIKSQQNLMNTGLIKTVQAQLYPSSKTENGVIVEYIVEEGNQMELQFGATFGGNTDGFPVSGFLQWSDKNLAGTGRDLSVSTTLSPSTQSVSLGLNDDWVGSKRWSNGVNLSVERSVRENVLQQGIGSEAYNGRDKEQKTYPLGYNNAQSWYSQENYPDSSYLMDYDYWRISLGYNTGYSFVWNPGTLTVSGGVSVGLNHAIYDSANYTPYELLIQRYNESWQFSNKLSFSLTWDGRDLKQNTTKGYLLSMNYTYAGGFLFGLSNYNRLGLSAAGYHSIFSYTNDKNENKALVLSATSNVSFMLPQYSNLGGYSSFGWHPSHDGATKYEMLYIDGMNIGRGFNVVYDQSFMWHNQFELTFPLVYQVVALEAFASATGVTADLEDLNSFSNINWYFAAGCGIKMMIPGFPLGLYLVKNATVLDNNGWAWESGLLFSSKNRPGSGMKLVLAITTSLY